MIGGEREQHSVQMLLLIGRIRSWLAITASGVWSALAIASSVAVNRYPPSAARPSKRSERELTGKTRIDREHAPDAGLAFRSAIFRITRA